MLNVLVLKISVELPTSGSKSKAFCKPYGRYSTTIIGPYTAARLAIKARTLLFTLAEMSITTPAKPKEPSSAKGYWYNSAWSMVMGAILSILIFCMGIS